MRKVTDNLIGHDLLDCLLDAVSEHVISPDGQPLWLPELPQPTDLARRRRSVEYSSSRKHCKSRLIMVSFLVVHRSKKG